MVIINGKTEVDYMANFIHKEISAPEAKTQMVEIPLSDGAINASELLAPRPFFKPRTITIVFEIRALREEWPGIWSTMLNDMHGQSVEVCFSDDPNWYWKGVAAVGQLEDHGSTAGVTVTVIAQPFKRTYWRVKSFDEGTSGSDVIVQVDVPYERAYPIFMASTDGLTVKYENETWTLQSGESDCYGLILHKGSNEITVPAHTGTVSMSYQGGSL